MAYQVLALKYRPRSFSEVVGQHHVTTTLMNALAAGRLHHAYLFTGARGVGKTTVARVLARALNCVKRKGPEPCGECGPCVEISSGASLDVQEIDGASNTGVDDVRELRERIKYLPSSGKYKIYIIDEVHMLSVSAFNALLKTLEEPPAHVVFIFATTEPHKIPATILSRCQRYDFRRIPPDEIAKTLGQIAKEEKVAVGDDAIRMIAREATGSLRDAESLLDQAIAFSGESVTSETIKSMLGILDRKLLFDAVGAVVARDPKRALHVLEEVFAAGSDLSRFASDILEVIRNLLVLSECTPERGTIDLMPDEMEVIEEMKGKIAAPELHQMFSIWYRVADEVAKSPFPKMLLEVGLLRLARVGPVRPIEEIVAKLDAVIGEMTETRNPRPETRNPKSPGPEIRDPKPEKATAVRFPRVSDFGSRVSGPEEANAVQVEAPPHALQASPTFAPVISPADVEAEKGWEKFMRWLVTERPQVASIFQHGNLLGIDDGIVRVTFENQLYADMLREAERKTQVEALFATFFKRPMRLEATSGCKEVPKPVRSERRRELEREALTSDIVQQAADILGAEVHGVKVEGKE